MNSTKIRIFVTTSHISTVYMTMLAKATASPGFTDVLFVDDGIRRNELLTLIRETAALHDWSTVHSFSRLVTEEHDFKPTFRKRVTRNFKSLPLIRNIYSSLLKKHLAAQDARLEEELNAVLEKITESPAVELYLMSQTHLHRTLFRKYPEAQVNYMEHGIGDYYYLLEPSALRKNFYAVFSEPYKKFLAARNMDYSWVKALPGKEKFPAIADELLVRHAKTLAGENLPAPVKPIIYILLEAVDMYHVPENFWTDYLNYILKEIKDPQRYHFILKPHPMHSRHSIEKTSRYFDAHNLEYTIIGGTLLSSTSAEILFRKWESKTEYVFCLFSSGCFYLSQLYPNPKIKYYYSAEFMSRYIDNAPPQYKKLFIEIRPLIEEVFAEKCNRY